MASEYQIRMAGHQEADEVGAVVAASFDSFRSALPHHIFRPYVDEATNIAARSDDAGIVVAEASGQIVGSVTYYPDASDEGMGWPSRFAGLRTLAVLPSQQGKGIGRSLCEWCVKTARQHKADAVALHTAKFMTSACKLYENMGFQRLLAKDLLASDVLGFDPDLGDQDILAYVLPLREQLIAGNAIA